MTGLRQKPLWLRDEEGGFPAAQGPARRRGRLTWLCKTHTRTLCVAWPMLSPVDSHSRQKGPCQWNRGPSGSPLPVVKRHLDGIAGIGRGKGRLGAHFSSKGCVLRPPAEMAREHPHGLLPPKTKVSSHPEVSPCPGVEKLSSLKMVTCHLLLASSQLSWEGGWLGCLQGPSTDEAQDGHCVLLWPTVAIRNVSQSSVCRSFRNTRT